MLGDGDAALAQRDLAIPGLATVLSPDALLAFVHGADDATTTAGISYVRYKAGRSCLTSLDIASASGCRTHVVRAYARDTEGATAFARDAERAVRDGATTVVDRAQRLLSIAFPHDRALPALARLHDDTARQRLYDRVGLASPDDDGLAPRRLVYKPSRRYVARVDRSGTPYAAVKGYTHADFPSLGPTPAWLDGSSDVRAARELGRHDRRCVRAIEWLPGELLADRIARGAATPELLRRVGRAIAALHAGPRDGWPRRDAARDAVSLRALASDVGALLPSEQQRITAITDAIAPRVAGAPGRAVPTHGDCYAKQFLVDDHQLGLIDFDEAALGDSHADLALFVAHLHRDAARGELTEAHVAGIEGDLLQGYASAGGAIDRRWLSLRLAEAILRLTPHPFRHRHDEWPTLTRALLDRAERALRDATVAPRTGGTPCGTSLPSASAPSTSATSTSAPSTSAASTPHSPGARTYLQLAVDPALAFAAPLLDPPAALLALRARRLGDPFPIRDVQDVSLIRHKPGRRAVLDVRLTRGDGAAARWIGKVRARGTDERSVILAHALRFAGLSGDGAASVGVPRPVGVVDAHHLSLFERVAGTPATALLLADGDAARIGTQMAVAMTALHQAPVTSRRRRTVDDELDTLATRLATWARESPALASALSLATTRCVALGAPLRGRLPRTLLHRDFYPDQLLLDGTRTWVVDLDLAADGDPALDAGNMIGHLLELSLRTAARHGALIVAARTFGDGALGALHTPLTSDAVARYAVLTLARLAEIARHHADRRPYAGTLLHHVLHLTRGAIGREPQSLDTLCDHFLEEGAS